MFKVFYKKKWFNGTLLVLIKIFITVVSWFPRFFLLNISWLISWVIFLISDKLKKIFYINIENIYNLPKKSKFTRQFYWQSIHSQVGITMESFYYFAKKSTQAITVNDSDLKTLIQGYQSSEGLVVINAHLGNWELSGAYMAFSSSERKIYALAKPTKIPAINLFLNDFREQFNLNILWAKDARVYKRIIQAVKNGNIVIFIMDQKPPKRQGQIVKFFGVNTVFVSGPAIMAIRLQCPVIYSFLIRTAPFSYRYITGEILPPRHGFQDPQKLTQIMASHIEKTIRLYPEQWLWYYRRWRW